MRPALFLDRDGVINVDSGYVHLPEQVEFVDGIFELVRAARAHGLEPVVVTNQSGIARGYFGEKEFQQLTAWIAECFAGAGAPLLATYHCPFHPTEGRGDYRRQSSDRKPAPGMILRAAREHGLDLGASWLLGDRHSDIQAGHAAGVSRLMLLAPEGDPAPPHGAQVVRSLHQAVQRLAQGAGGMGG